MFEDILGPERKKMIKVGNVIKVYCSSCNFFIQYAASMESDDNFRCLNCGGETVYMEMEFPTPNKNGSFGSK